MLRKNKSYCMEFVRRTVAAIFALAVFLNVSHSDDCRDLELILGKLSDSLPSMKIVSKDVRVKTRREFKERHFWKIFNSERIIEEGLNVNELEDFIRDKNAKGIFSEISCTTAVVFGRRKFYHKSTPGGGSYLNDFEQYLFADARMSANWDATNTWVIFDLNPCKKYGGSYKQFDFNFFVVTDLTWKVGDLLRRGAKIHDMKSSSETNCNYEISLIDGLDNRVGEFEIDASKGHVCTRGRYIANYGSVFVQYECSEFKEVVAGIYIPFKMRILVRLKDVDESLLDDRVDYNEGTDDSIDITILSVEECLFERFFDYTIPSHASVSDYRSDVINNAKRGNMPENFRFPIYKKIDRIICTNLPSEYCLCDQKN